ncbi:MAG TPA: hypothetical protein VGC09_15055 [Rhodopila sp.]
MTAFREQVNAYIAANLSPAARSKILADVARSGVAALVASGRAPPVYQTFVDGRQGADASTVRGDGGGVILYRFSYQAQAAVFALAFLKARGPSRSGRFRNAFYFGVDGRFVPEAQFNPASVPPGAEITIGNTEPYARKIDVQLEGNRRLHVSVPAGMFDDCVVALRSAFRGVIAVKRVYSLRFPGQYIRRTGVGRGTPTQSPALIISAVI